MCDLTGDRRPGIKLPEEIDLSDPFPDVDDVELPVVGPIPTIKLPDPENLPDGDDVPALDELPELPVIGPIPTVRPPNPDNFPTVDEIVDAILGDDEGEPEDDDGIGVNLPDPDNFPTLEDLPAADIEEILEFIEEGEAPGLPRIPSIILPDPDNFPTVEELTD